MRRASPERGENSGPARNFIRSLTPNPELENPGSEAVPPLQLLPAQIRIRTTPDSGHDVDGPAHLRFVPILLQKSVALSCEA
jgi:hypothetical protein